MHTRKPIILKYLMIRDFFSILLPATQISADLSQLIILHHPYINAAEEWQMHASAFNRIKLLFLKTHLSTSETLDSIPMVTNAKISSIWANQGSSCFRSTTEKSEMDLNSASEDLYQPTRLRDQLLVPNIKQLQLCWPWSINISEVIKIELKGSWIYQIYIAEKFGHCSSNHGEYFQNKKERKKRTKNPIVSRKNIQPYICECMSELFPNLWLQL